MTDDKKETSKLELDDELSNLLDSALEDFSKDGVKENGKTKSTEKEVSTSKSKQPNPQEWSEDFIQQAAGQFEANFANLLSGDQMSPELIQQKLQQMADAAQQVLENSASVPDSSNDIAASISQAIQGLSAGAENLQAPVSEEDLMKMFTGNGGLGPNNDLLPFMQGMMQGLLSKDVLGPSLQDFVDKLPDYIENNKDTLAKEDIERYRNQKKLMEEVLIEINKEEESDSNEVKGERFTKVLGLMQKLQDYGQPPSELVGDLDAPFNFDPQGNPLNLNPGANADCNVM